MTDNNFRKTPIALSLMLLIATPVPAQEPEPELVEVTGSQDDPARAGIAGNTVSDAFGEGLTSEDIARSVTPIDQWLLEAVAVEDLRDLRRVTPNTYGATGFGAPSLPTLRGQLGEVFEAGIRRQVGNNGLGIPLSFNAVEQVDVVRGTPSVILGTTQRTGGFVNLQPKRPDLADTWGTVQVRGGEWDRYRTGLDYSRVLEQDRSAVRVSYEHRDEGSFYDYAGLDSDNLFLAYRLRPGNSSEWNLSLEYYDIDWTDNAGINRPTQKLIDDGLYVQGQGVQPDGSTVPGAGGIVSPTGLVEIDRSTVLTDPLDINGAQTLLLHSVYRRELSDDLALVNRTYFEYLEREEIAQNSFVEIIDGAKTFENRSELHFGDTVAGVGLRYNDVLGYSQFTTEADLPIDLTAPLENRRIPLGDAQKERLVELRPGVFVSPGGQYDLDGDGAGNFNLSDTTDSASLQTGLFVQHRQDLTERLWVTAGLRGDYYDVEARDPLAPAGVQPASDDYSDWLKSGSASLHYRPREAFTGYATLAYQESTSNSLAGGNTLSGDNTISPVNFATQNTLYEVGLKYRPDATAWYADAALFDQTRSLRNRDGSNSGIRTRGLEMQLFYQGEKLWATAGASYLDARFDDSAAFQDSRQVLDAFDDSRPDIVAGTGRGAPNFTVFAPADARLHGLPEWSASAAAGYRLNERWSLGGSAVFSGRYPLDYLQTVEIPAQFTLNANAEYRFNGGRSALRLQVFNLTDEENWAPVFEGGYFGSTLVFPELPRHVDLVLAHRF
ncbi:TonB-dependent receptor [Microbulbifer yueqingensis]|uniref:Outer membrane receptor proteins, mostly Fe transport n=1 Tax=Microbulbifer yueqingensis TaxID=658219 RepID=A0A1G8ZVW8_9GAMM|nr:TonB-dependent receptor [Microbulbifer yueqingensis]SDK19131.1 Outer membrane receptor proteins, mostly Fe transport [Microbulbifer yueqingensis]